MLGVEFCINTSHCISSNLFQYKIVVVETTCVSPYNLFNGNMQLTYRTFYVCQRQKVTTRTKVSYFRLILIDKNCSLVMQTHIDNQVLNLHVEIQSNHV